MVAASVWSLLIPAIEEAEAAGGIGWIPAAGGFILGSMFLMSLDYILPHLSGRSSVRGYFFLMAADDAVGIGSYFT